MTYLTPYNTRRNVFGLPAGFGSLEHQLGSLFAGLPGFFEPAVQGTGAGGDQTIKLRWYEKPDAYLVRLDLPGVAKENIELELEDGTMQVSATRIFEQDSQDEGKLVYRRTFRLPETVQDEAIVASVENGVLSLHLPKSEKAKPRHIRIK